MSKFGSIGKTKLGNRIKDRISTYQKEIEGSSGQTSQQQPPPQADEQGTRLGRTVSKSLLERMNVFRANEQAAPTDSGGSPSKTRPPPTTPPTTQPDSPATHEAASSVESVPKAAPEPTTQAETEPVVQAPSKHETEPVTEDVPTSSTTPEPTVQTEAIPDVRAPTKQVPEMETESAPTSTTTPEPTIQTEAIPEVQHEAATGQPKTETHPEAQAEVPHEIYHEEAQVHREPEPEIAPEAHQETHEKEQPIAQTEAVPETQAQAQEPQPVAHTEKLEKVQPESPQLHTQVPIESDITQAVEAQKQPEPSSAGSEDFSSEPVPVAKEPQYTNVEEAGAGEQNTTEQAPQDTREIIQESVVVEDTQTGETKTFFRLHYYTRYGENLYVVGSAPEIGEWQLGKASRMFWTDDHWWELTLPMKTTPKGFEFKYAVMHDYVPYLRWEERPNRVVSHQFFTKSPNVRFDNLWAYE